MARAIPDWPGAMKRTTAAAYCEMSVAEFEREMLAGNLPLPIDLGKGPRWRRADIDEHLEQLAGKPGDWRASAPLYRDEAA